jgi:hypothetical protein
MISFFDVKSPTAPFSCAGHFWVELKARKTLAVVRHIQATFILQSLIAAIVT